MRLGTRLPDGGRTLQGAHPKLADFCTAPVAGFYAAVDTDMAFHVGLARLTGNPLLETVTEAMLSWLFAFYKPLLHWEGREQTTLKEHAALVDLLAANDAEGAAELMRQHLRRSDPLYTNRTDRS